MSLAGQWDAMNGEVLMCPAVQASMDHDRQLEYYSTSDVKPVEILMEQLTEPQPR